MWTTTGLCCKPAFGWSSTVLSAGKTTAKTRLETLLPEFPDQIMTGMDAARHTYWKSYGGSPGLTYLLTTFRDELNQRGLGDYWQKLMVHNPATLFSFNTVTKSH